MATVDAPDGLIEQLRAAQTLARLIGDGPAFHTALRRGPPPRAQVALWRVLQDRTCRPLGASQEQRADVRFARRSGRDSSAATG